MDRLGVGALAFLPGAGAATRNRKQRGFPVEDIKVALHIFLAVLILGTLWRVGQYHLIASSNPHLSHLGQAMAVQY
jgi:hypothetical protein